MVLVKCDTAFLVLFLNKTVIQARDPVLQVSDKIRFLAKLGLNGCNKFRLALMFNVLCLVLVDTCSELRDKRLGNILQFFIQLYDMLLGMTFVQRRSANRAFVFR